MNCYDQYLSSLLDNLPQLLDLEQQYDQNIYKVQQNLSQLNSISNTLNKQINTNKQLIEQKQNTIQRRQELYESNNLLQEVFAYKILNNQEKQEVQLFLEQQNKNSQNEVLTHDFLIKCISKDLVAKLSSIYINHPLNNSLKEYNVIFNAVHNEIMLFFDLDEDYSIKEVLQTFPNDIQNQQTQEYNIYQFYNLLQKYDHNKTICLNKYKYFIQFIQIQNSIKALDRLKKRKNDYFTLILIRKLLSKFQDTNLYFTYRKNIFSKLFKPYFQKILSTIEKYQNNFYQFNYNNIPENGLPYYDNVFMPRFQQFNKNNNDQLKQYIIDNELEGKTNSTDMKKLFAKFNNFNDDSLQINIDNLLFAQLNDETALVDTDLIQNFDLFVVNNQFQMKIAQQGFKLKQFINQISTQYISNKMQKDENVFYLSKDYVTKNYQIEKIFLYVVQFFQLYLQDEVQQVNQIFFEQSIFEKLQIMIQNDNVQNEELLDQQQEEYEEIEENSTLTEESSSQQMRDKYYFFQVYKESLIQQCNLLIKQITDQIQQILNKILSCSNIPQTVNLILYIQCKIENFDLLKNKYLQQVQTQQCSKQNDDQNNYDSFEDDIKVQESKLQINFNKKISYSIQKFYWQYLNSCQKNLDLMLHYQIFTLNKQIPLYYFNLNNEQELKKYIGDNRDLIVDRIKLIVYALIQIKGFVHPSYYNKWKQQFMNLSHIISIQNFIDQNM